MTIQEINLRYEKRPKTEFNIISKFIDLIGCLNIKNYKLEFIVLEKTLTYFELKQRALELGIIKNLNLQEWN